MFSRILFALIAMVLLFAAPAGAQQQAAPAANPLDNIPDAIPFATPYGTPIMLDRAKMVADAAVAEAKKRGWAIDVAVVDPSGTLVTLQRMDGAQGSSVKVAEHKARAAATYRRPTKAFEEGVQKGFTYILTLDDVIAARGGIPLIEAGKVVGAIGCSGGTGSQDEAVCSAGAALIK